MNSVDIFFEAMKTGVAALSILCMYRICLKIIEMNEQVIGRTLVSHNKKLKEIESAGVAGADLAPLKQEIANLKAELSAQLKDEVRRAVPTSPSVLSIEEAGGGVPSPEMEAEIKSLKKAASSLKQEVEELKYVISSINPMEYVTVEELGDLINKKIEKELGARKAL